MALDPVKFISNSGIYKALSQNAQKCCQNLGAKLEASGKKDVFYRTMNRLEPTGFNNSFPVLAGLMFAMVIVPRVLTAAKRNSENKEATKDEITEILFRDIQTVLIILFALKAVNSVIAGKATKLTGLPMTQKPFASVINPDEKGLKKLNFKSIGKNILDTLHPTDGVRALTNDEFQAMYSNFGSIDEISKLFEEIKVQKGDPDKVFNNVMDYIIEAQEKLIANSKQLSSAGFSQDATKANELLDLLKELKTKGTDGLKDENLNENIKEQLVNFFKNDKNPLVLKAKGLNGWLRTCALAFEATYLGFGLPALNEKRLEKKYLSNNPDPKFNKKETKKDDTLINRQVKSKSPAVFSGITSETVPSK